ncbi:MAG: tRNA guanosine(34) transglycosylase Tgt [Patescibacteria group bacterium]
MSSIQPPKKGGFIVTSRDSKTRARTGILSTKHGKVETPSYVMVATNAYIRTLKPSDLKKLGIQIVISNTYHLWDKALKNKKDPYLTHTLLGTTMPMMTDSGGFQVFSFGAAREHNVGKVLQRERRKSTEKSLITIKEKGVDFLLDGKKRFLSPEISMDIQEKLGANIIFAFDECTSPLHSFKHNKEALERTNRWALRCLKAHKRTDQLLFGIVQGGRFNSLRTKSAKEIGAMPFGGFGIGGSYGKDEMREKLEVVIPYLPDEKPRHLLGIGRVEDIFIAVENGIDTFDCVIPTREGRHGRIWTKNGHYDIRRGKYKTSKKVLEAGCKCPVCSPRRSGAKAGSKGVTQAKVHTLFKSPTTAKSTTEILPPSAPRAKAGRYATIHNIWFFNNLLREIRASIKRGKFKEFKDKYLKQYGSARDTHK